MLIEIGLLLITHLLLPTIFLSWLWRGEAKSKLDWLLNILVDTLYTIYIFFSGRWDWLSYYLRFILIILFFIAVLRSYKKVRHLPFYPIKKYQSLFSLGVNCFIIIIFANLSFLILQGFSFHNKPVEFAFPLKDGTYYVAHGGNSSIINYHNTDRAQQYALDLVKLNSFGTRANGLYPTELTKYAIFQDTVYSPCTGKVINAVNSFPDLIPPETDRQHPAGNYVLIACDRVEILVAHLMSGTIVVNQGEFVSVNQPIAQVGNSGNTTEPHLHIHARQENSGETILDGIGIPMTFSGRFLLRNSLVY
ncbi:M23 family metallopeptidase [Gloeocapsopsis crepidinum LEGE 06123]|uniref:M23 family metallopeptidase n=1 Tax=Gloeocapsopsis crepidinum LEGE 06123 TaxID=588587 RepID=A0ABR9UTX9_9CHRO|nr:M23 family metallopeptidase [Gloeocapsopsis crepidinum LEGE 06123]